MIVLHILLMMLKVIGIILLCVLGLILLISFLPVGVTAEYSSEGVLVLAHAGPVKLQLIPKRPKKPKPEGKEKPKGEKKEKDKKPKQEPEKPEEAKPKRKLGGMIPMFRELLGLVIQFQARFRNKLRIKHLVLQLTVGGFGEDPAKQAILYGRAWAAIGNVMPLLMETFRIEKRSVGADIDFTTQENTIYAKATAVITVGAILRMGIYYGIRGLFIYRKHTKKGGKKHGTSSQ